VISLDTNVLARYLLADSPKQGRAAARLLEQATSVFVPVTVLLELGWVLQSVGCSREEVAAGLNHLIGLPCLVFQHRGGVLRALEWYEGGMDLADAMHLALSAEAEAVLTFDERFVRKAGQIGSFPPVSSIRV